MVPKDLCELSSSEMREFLNSFDTVLCDCDGVIWNLTDPIKGVHESLEKLKKCGKTIYYVSNNSTFGRTGLLQNIKKTDPDVTADNIITPTLAITSYLKNLKFDKEIFLLGAKAMKVDFENAGFRMANTEYDKTVDSIASFREMAKDDENIGAVICDFDVHLTNVKLTRSCIFLRRPDVLFMTGANDRKIFIDPKITIPGPYHYQNSLIEVTERSPLEFGKPSKNLQKYLMRNCNIQNPSRVLFVGDSIEQDIAFGTSCGYQTLLVLTGVSKLCDMTKSQSDDRTSNYYLNSLGDLSDVIKRKLDL